MEGSGKKREKRGKTSKNEMGEKTGGELQKGGEDTSSSHFCLRHRPMP